MPAPSEQPLEEVQRYYALGLTEPLRIVVRDPNAKPYTLRPWAREEKQDA